MRRRVDYTNLILLLAFLIVGIFAGDFIRRQVKKWKQAETPLIINSESSLPFEMEPMETYPPEETMPIIVTETTMPVIQDTERTIELSADAVHEGSLILVDAAHPLTHAPESVSFMNIKYDHFRLPTKNLTINTEMAQPLVNLFNDFYKATSFGNIMIYITMNSTTAPAYSMSIPERASGLTMDLAVFDDATKSHTPFTGEGKFAWLPQNAAKYGFVQRFTSEKAEKTGQDALTWHYRYVGVPHASYMTENKLCLEEYLEMLKKDHTGIGKRLEITVGSEKYEVYYAPASVGASRTEIRVPNNRNVVVSGDNQLGYIITMTKKTEEDTPETTPATTTAAAASTTTTTTTAAAAAN